MSKKNEFITLLILLLLQFVFCFLFILNEFFFTLYALFFEISLIFLVYCSRRNSVFMVLSFSFFLYLYQVPFLQFFPESNISVYNFTYNDISGSEVFVLYSFILIVFSSMLLLSLHFTKFDPLIRIKSKMAVVSGSGFFISSILCFSLVLFNVYNAGGIQSLSVMNKFESSEAAKFIFFTYKDFFILMCLSFFSEKKLSYLKLFLIILVILFELFLAKRYLIVVFGVLFILFNHNKLNVKYFILIILGVVSANLSKLFYYSLPYALMNDVTDFWGTVIYFDLQYFLSNIYYLGEFSGHIRLTYLSIDRGLEVSPNEFVKLLLAGIPLSNTIFDINYVSVGERLRLFLGEDWAGLASSPYIMPYLSLGHFGVIIIYSIYFAVLNFMMHLAKYSLLTMIFFIYVTPTLLFYFQREPIVVIFKALTVGLPVVLLFYTLLVTFRLLFRRSAVIN